MPQARSEAGEEERQRSFKDEIEKEQEINRGWFARRFGAGGKTLFRILAGG